MGTSGSRVAAVLAVVLVGAFGCTSAPPAPEPDSAASRSPESPGPSGEGQFCLTTLPDAWQEALDAGVLPMEDGEQALVKLVAADGSVLVESKLRGHRNQLRWFAGGRSEPTLVHDFGLDHPEWQVLGASFDGRYLAYSVYHTFRIFSASWSLYVWDSRSGGRPQLIAESPSGANGEPLTGPLNYPVAYQGQVVWVQATGEGSEETALYRYRVGGGSREVLHVGHPGYPRRMGSLLVWPESPAPGELTRLHALSLDTGEAAAPPGPLADLEGPAYLAASHDTVVWVGADMRDLWVWRRDRDGGPVRVLRAAPDEHLQWPHIAGDIVSWDLLNTAQFALDLRSGGYTQVTPVGGFTDSGGAFLMVAYAPDLSRGKENAVSEQTVVDTRELPPLPGCG